MKKNMPKFQKLIFWTKYSLYCVLFYRILTHSKKEMFPSHFMTKKPRLTERKKYHEHNPDNRNNWYEQRENSEITTNKLVDPTIENYDDSDVEDAGNDGSNE